MEILVASFHGLRRELNEQWHVSIWKWPVPGDSASVAITVCGQWEERGSQSHQLVWPRGSHRRTYDSSRPPCPFGSSGSSGQVEPEVEEVYWEERRRRNREGRWVGPQRLMTAAPVTGEMGQGALGRQSLRLRAP